MKSRKFKLACMGDSLTEGYNITINSRWSNLLQKDLNIEIINSGISGDTTSGMLARFQHDVIVHQPTHVIIMGGTNDLFYNFQDDHIIGNILSMTRHARHNNILAIIGLPTPFFAADQTGEKSIFPPMEIVADRLVNFRKKLKQFSIDDERPFIDFGANMTPDLFLEDGLHPNEEGQVVMKENAKLVLLEILKNL